MPPGGGPGVRPPGDTARRGPVRAFREQASPRASRGNRGSRTLRGL
ncbi:Uncharacterised protein [Amycolatopsis camponoti]|uniref:Uncharacterized protein n=1 Tax=Amycolatopsis camponoti TaxID=2606593 RepID=A0A6I8LTQ5_9PSEU|nr:Uncharacterised protein [Amycolatopsis camponoti]